MPTNHRPPKPDLNDTPAASAQGRAGQRAARAELAEALTARAKFLPDDDAAIVLAIFRDGLRITQVAAMLRRPPTSLGYRVRTIVARMSSPRFAWCLRQIERQASGLAPPSDAWSIERQRVASLRLLHGRGLRDVARRTGLSVHHVRKHLVAIEALFQDRTQPAPLPAADLRRSA
jgi:hypothetical protein